MSDRWFFYGGIITIILVYTMLLINIFWHIGYNHGYNDGRVIARRENRQKRRKHMRNNNRDVVKVLPYNSRKHNSVKESIYINRGIK